MVCLFMIMSSITIESMQIVIPFIPTTSKGKSMINRIEKSGPKK